ncbi:MAG: hypothetical protein ACRYGK_04975 [Janthinobacterium lividum]
MTLHRIGHGSHHAANNPLAAGAMKNGVLQVTEHAILTPGSSGVFPQCTNSAIRIMMGMGIPRKNNRIERMVNSR